MIYGFLIFMAYGEILFSYGLWFMIEMVYDLWFMVSGLRLLVRIPGSGFRVYGFRFRARVEN